MTTKTLEFCWWNLAGLRHYAPSRLGERSWPQTASEYGARRAAVEAVFRDDLSTAALHLVTLCEVTPSAARDLRDRLFPGHSVFTAIPEEQAQVAVIFDASRGLSVQEPWLPISVPAGTRPMVVVDLVCGLSKVRFIACHWPSRVGRRSGAEGERSRILLAEHLSGRAYEFVRKAPEGEARHVVVLGDLNDEPMDATLRDHLRAERSRGAVQAREHYTDAAVHRIKLYDCAWRWMGELRPHDGGLDTSRDAAGSYYWDDERSWFTLDHVMVSGGLLGVQCPFLDESGLRVVASERTLRSNGLPGVFTAKEGGVSDHLPLRGRLVLER